MWSATSVNCSERRGHCVTAAVDRRVSPDLSRISGSPDEQREQTSSGELTGAFHSTFSYPLHSTLITAASAALSPDDLSCALETVDNADLDDQERTASDEAALIGCASTSAPGEVEQDVEDVETRDRPAANLEELRDFVFDDVTVPSRSAGQNATPVTSTMPFGSDAGGDCGDRRPARTTSYFPPLSTTLVASAAADADAPLDRPRLVEVVGRWPECDDDVGADASLEAVRGSPCDDERTSSPSRVLDVGCRRCRPDLSVAGAHGPTFRRRPERHCVSAGPTSKSGAGRGTGRMARETGRCDLRHTFNGSCLQEQDVRYESLTVRDLFRVRPSNQCPNDFRSARVDYSQRQRRPRGSRTCRCGVEDRNAVDPRIGRSTRGVRRSLAPSDESKSKVKRSERYTYFDAVRKRTLVNRLKQFSGCFCDTGCGRRMRTLANV